MSADARTSEAYRKKVKSVREAVGLVQAGHRIVSSHAAGEPIALHEELWGQRERLRDVEVVHMIALGPTPCCRPEAAAHFRHNSLFVGPGSRKAVAERRADFTPVFFSEVPRLFQEGLLPVDVAFLQVAPPDAHGNLSLGVSADYGEAAWKAAKLVVAEVNPRMPRTYDTAIPLSAIDAIAEVDHPLIEIAAPTPSLAERRIGEIIAGMVPDRANLQLGIGAIPDMVLAFLGGKRDLGIHSEMLSDGIVELQRRGVVNNRYNNLNPGKSVANFLLGSRALYGFVHENDAVLMRPADYTNRITVAGAVERLVSINSAIQVDLQGQVCADMIGSAQYSAVGGQVDFVRAASLSPGGQSIIAMPSTAKGDTVSRIVVRLDPGACVTTSRNDVHEVVTEYGVADLRGKSVRARAQALIAIAHPSFRDRLSREAAEAGLL